MLFRASSMHVWACCRTLSWRASGQEVSTSFRIDFIARRHSASNEVNKSAWNVRAQAKTSFLMTGAVNSSFRFLRHSPFLRIAVWKMSADENSNIRMSHTCTVTLPAHWICEGIHSSDSLLHRLLWMVYAVRIDESAHEQPILHLIHLSGNSTSVFVETYFAFCHRFVVQACWTPNTSLISRNASVRRAHLAELLTDAILILCDTIKTREWRAHF